MVVGAKLFSIAIVIVIIHLVDGVDNTYEIDCNNLRMGQYICPHPDYDFIDTKTQQPKGCRKENKAKGILDYSLVLLSLSIIFKV